jgi:aryl-alcohol dehydrogenase-like predicted oxidoreductase
LELILGTATFGTGYGIANGGFKLRKSSVKEIVWKAQSLGISHFDTAPAYGAGEQLLGRYLNHQSEPRVSSKISNDSAQSVELMISSVKRTLKKTGAKKLTNLYLHDPEALFSPKVNETIAGLRVLIDMKLVDRVGISSYSLSSLLRAKEIFPGLSVFQVPENICDRRLLKSKDLMNLHDQGDQLIVRSIFLQGLLLMSPKSISTKFGGAASNVSQLTALAKSCNVSVLDLCVGYAKSIPWASGIVVGTVSTHQLTQVVESEFQLPENWDLKVEQLPDKILDPRRW